MTMCPDADAAPARDMTRLIARAAEPPSADEWAIRRLNDLWIHANNTRDLALFRSLWTEDATFGANEPAAFTATGVDSIMRLYAELCDRFPFFFTTCHSGLVRVDGNAGSAVWHMNEVAQGPAAAGGMVNFGLYEDSWNRTAGGWRLRSRVFTYLYLDRSALAGQWMPVPTTIANPFAS